MFQPYEVYGLLVEVSQEREKSWHEDVLELNMMLLMK